jgi:hypothetical protein
MVPDLLANSSFTELCKTGTVLIVSRVDSVMSNRTILQTPVVGSKVAADPKRPSSLGNPQLPTLM